MKVQITKFTENLYYNFSYGFSLSDLENKINYFLQDNNAEIKEINLSYKKHSQGMESIQAILEIEISWIKSIALESSEICLKHIYKKLNKQSWLEQYSSNSEDGCFRLSSRDLLPINKKNEKEFLETKIEDIKKEYICNKTKEYFELIFENNYNFTYSEETTIKGDIGDDDFYYQSVSTRFIELSFLIFKKTKKDYKLSFHDLSYRHWKTAVIVFTSDSFTKNYSEDERSYYITEKNKDNDYIMNCVNGEDDNVSLKSVLTAKRNPWKIDYCYIVE